VAEEIKSAGGLAQAYEVDVTDSASVERLASAATNAFGGVNLVFNNAGVFTFGALERTKPADFRWVFEVNVFGSYNCMMAFLPLLRETAKGGGLAHIVNTGSENSLGVPPMGPFTAYTATKHAVLGMSDGVRRDLEGSGVGVSILCPGPVNTRLWDSASARQDRFGGPRQAPPAAAEALKNAQSPADVARITFEGIDGDEFLIVTDPEIRKFAQKRTAEIETALDLIDRRRS
jgi:NAD(P)-dependent dehydrogenase (short-subunit alcohol dehydrogenase family)